jgi:hypothetical protein
MVYAMLYVILPEILAISPRNKKKHCLGNTDEAISMDNLYQIEVPKEDHKETDMISPHTPAFNNYEVDSGQTNIVLNPN